MTDCGISDSDTADLGMFRAWISVVDRTRMSFTLKEGSHISLHSFRKPTNLKRHVACRVGCCPAKQFLATDYCSTSAGATTGRNKRQISGNVGAVKKSLFDRLMFSAAQRSSSEKLLSSCFHLNREMLCGRKTSARPDRQNVSNQKRWAGGYRARCPALYVFVYFSETARKRLVAFDRCTSISRSGTSTFS